MFTWIPIHRDAIHRILEYRGKEKELLAVLREMEEKGLKVISLQDEDQNEQKFPLAVIDPFTFLASFNRGITNENRKENWRFLKARWNLNAPVPEDFTGIPKLHNMSSWLFPYASKRPSDHTELLWQLAWVAADGDIGQVGEELFNRCVKLDKISISNLTIGLFWINPHKFLPADNKTSAYGEAKGIFTKPKDYQSYQRWLNEMTDQVGSNYPQVSHDAHLFSKQNQSKTDYLHETPPRSQAPQYWIFSPGTGAEEWEEFHSKGIMAIGWDELGDLRNFKSDEEISQRLQKLRPKDKFPTMDTLACWEFVHDIKIRDVIFVNRGRDKIVGYGVVEGDYKFADERPYYKHVRKVNWLAKGRWELPEGETKVHAKTLTGIADPTRIAVITKLVGLDIGTAAKTAPIKAPSATGICYWWLNANPKIWNLEDWSLGRRQTYTSHNEKGNKRQKYRYFQEVKPGDLVIGYVTSPQKEVVAVCKITKALHQTDEGEKIEIEKIEELVTPVAYETLQANPDLANCEPLINNQGSLFKLTEPEYEVIRSLIDDTNIQPKTEIELYDKKKAMKGLFLKETQFDEMLAALKEKKNVVLQGAPGVGKTYIAKRLAFALVESNDPQRVEMIQFHQSYSYEDFIQGFRPTNKGHFDLKSGIFHQFCRRAQREEAEGKPYVFVIDEINRGNLSKIFGELMMLIEPDKRGREHAIPLAYCQDGDDKFYIPENLYLIGMMNTADRSLAMVDYALRRRFRFVTLRPEFSSKAFREFLIEAGAWRELADKIVTRMNALNEVIVADTKNLGPGYQIGHSYFCPRNGTKPDGDWYIRVIESEIVPLIQEYWFDNEQKVKEQRSALLA